MDGQLISWLIRKFNSSRRASPIKKQLARPHRSATRIHTLLGNERCRKLALSIVLPVKTDTYQSIIVSNKAVKVESIVLDLNATISFYRKYYVLRGQLSVLFSRNNCLYFSHARYVSLASYRVSNRLLTRSLNLYT